MLQFYLSSSVTDPAVSQLCEGTDSTRVKVLASLGEEGASIPEAPSL